MFLTKEELQLLTGYKTYKRQRNYLEKEKIVFTVSGSGMPIVSKNNIENYLSNKGEIKPSRIEPNAERFKRFLDGA